MLPSPLLLCLLLLLSAVAYVAHYSFVWAELAEEFASSGVGWDAKQQAPSNQKRKQQRRRAEPQVRTTKARPQISYNYPHQLATVPAGISRTTCGAAAQLTSCGSCTLSLTGK